MPRYRHVSGSEVEVRDGKVMDPTIWTPLDDKKAPAKKAAASKKSD